MKEVFKAITKNAKETEKIAEIFAHEVLMLKQSRAVVVGLEGDLGAGKTTFSKGFARGLGIREEMKSPTFILMRVFKTGSASRRKNLMHFDAYRIDSEKEFMSLGIKEYLKNPKNILLIEWSDRIKKALPKKYFLFKLKHFDSPERRAGKNKREIIFYA